MIEPSEVAAFACCLLGLFLTCADRRGRAAIWREVRIWVPETLGLASALAWAPVFAVVVAAFGWGR